MKLIQILIILILLPLTYAQDDDFFTDIPASNVNIDQSVSWVTQQPKTTVEQAAFALLAATKSDLFNNHY